METEGNVAQVALYILQFKKSIWIQFSYNTKDNTSEKGRTAGTKSQKALVVHQVVLPVHAPCQIQSTTW